MQTFSRRFKASLAHIRLKRRSA